MDKKTISMIQKGLDKTNILAKRLEALQQNDKDVFDKLNKFLFENYSDILASQYFLIENAKQIAMEEPWRGITPYIVANNFRSIVLLIMYDVYKLFNSQSI